MKSKLFVLLSLLFFALIFATSCSDDPVQDFTDYYWSNGEKVSLKKIEGVYMILYFPSEEDAIRDYCAKIKADFQSLTYPSNYEYNVDGETYEAGREDFTKSAILKGNSRDIEGLFSNVYYWAPFYQTLDGCHISVDNKFFVKLKPDYGLSVLEDVAEKYGVEIIGPDRTLENWYGLRCTTSEYGDAIKVSNIFYETGFFELVTPNFIGAGSSNN